MGPLSLRRLHDRFGLVEQAPRLPGRRAGAGRLAPCRSLTRGATARSELVVTDLDGTLSDARERIHPASVRAVRDLEAGGIPVLVATGRRLRMAWGGAGGGRPGRAGGVDGALGSTCATAGCSTRSRSRPRPPPGCWRCSVPPA